MDFLQYKTEYSSGLVKEFSSSRRCDYAFDAGVERERVVDIIAVGVLFETLDFHGGVGAKSFPLGADSFSDYKFWTVTGSCRRAYPSMSDKFKHHGRTLFDFLKAMERMEFSISNAGYLYWSAATE